MGSINESTRRIFWRYSMMADATQRRIWFERRAFQFFTRYIFFRTTEKRDSIRSVDAKLLRSLSLTPRLWTLSFVGLHNWDSLPTESTLQTLTTTGTSSNTETVSISA